MIPTVSDFLLTLKIQIHGKKESIQKLSHRNKQLLLTVFMIFLYCSRLVPKNESKNVPYMIWSIMVHIAGPTRQENSNQILNFAKVI
jgi:hypothetical protein